MENKANKLTTTASIVVSILFYFSATAQHSLYLNSVQNGVTSGTNLAVSLHAKGFKGIVGIQGSIVWDSTTFKYNNITYGTNSSLQLGASNLNISTNYLTFLWIDPALNPESIPDTSILLTMNFTVKKNVVGYNSVLLSNSPTPVQIADSIEITPVTLKSFSGFYSAGNVNISWSTATELNVANYSIQRSINGIDFVDVKTIPALNKLAGAIYNYSDAINTTGKLYYRLQIVDRNRASVYSKIVLLTVGEEFTCSLSPNPVKNKILTLHINNNKSEDVIVQVVNIFGIAVQQKTAHLFPGVNDISLGMINYPKGSYSVIIKGTHILQKQFIKL